MGNHEELNVQSSVGYFLLSFISGVVFVIILINCVCSDTKSDKDEEPNGSVTRRDKPKSKKSKKAKRESSEEIALEIIESEQARHSAGSNGSGPGIHNGNRPKSHLHDGTRALPEIPDSQANYNSSGERSYHPYAMVQGDPDSTYAAVSGASDLDPDYAGISTADASSETYAQVKDNVQPSNSNNLSRAKNTHPYAEVTNQEATYAQISEKSDLAKRKTITSTVSVETIDSSHLPPVPDKLPNINDPESKRSSSAVGSPTLPPRNSILSSDSIPFADADSPQHEMYPGLNAADGTSPVGKRKEPPYDDITARESLSHIRERQAKEEETSSAAAFSHAGFDREYDEIKSVPSARSDTAGNRHAACDRNSLASDTYAEIWQSDISGRRQSSTYSHVKEENDHAPTPPPLESLKHARLSRNRPASVLSHTSGLYTTVEDIDIESPNNKSNHPIYAVPNKADKRRTIHTSVPRDSQASSVTEHLYSQVDKTRKPKQNKEKRHSEYDNIDLVDVNDNQGARPKISSSSSSSRDANQNNDSNSSPKPTTLNQNDSDQSLQNKRHTTTGYQTIGDVENPDVAYDDPDYDTVEERTTVIVMDSYDVDYESLPGSAAAMVTRGNVRTTTAAENESHVVRLSAGGDNSPVLSEDDSNANPSSPNLIHISEHQPRTHSFHRREHIYEQITDNSHENIYTADPTRHIVARKATKGAAEVQPQFLTSL